MIELKMEIDRIKEYVNTDLCQKCIEMSERLRECEEILKEYIKQISDQL